MSRSGQLPPPAIRANTLAHDRVDRPLAAYARDYPDRDDTGRHAHERAQLLYAVAGVMRIATDAASFVVPPGRALWVPGRMAHTVTMQGAVAMRALFVREDAARAGPAETTVL